MKLYWFRVAPNPTKVRLYIAEKIFGGAKIEFESEVVKIVKGEGQLPQFLEKNPFGTVPVLELDDGFRISESLSIIEYLEETFPDPNMWGSTLKQRVRGKELERIAEMKVLEPIAQYIHATQSPIGLPPNEVLASNALSRIVKPLEFFEALMLDGRKYLCGESVTVADCTMQAGFQFARFAKMDLGLDDHPRLKNWDTVYRERIPATEILVT